MVKRKLVPKDKLIQYFSAKFKEFRPSTNGWYVFTCPICGKDKAALNPDAPFMKCWKGCFWGKVEDVMEEAFGIPKDTYYKEVMSLNIPISLPTSLQMTNSMKDRKRLEYKKHNRIIDSYPQALPLPESYRLISEASGINGMKAIKYLESRNFDIDYLASKGVGYCSSGPYDGRIIIPFFRNGVCRYYQGRSFVGAKIKYFNPPKEAVGIGKEDIIYNEDAIHMGYSKVWIMEGALDALTIGDTGTSTQGWSMSRWQELKYMNGNMEEMVFVPDCGVDTAGVKYYHRAVQAAITFIRSKRIKVIDTNRLSMYGKDVNEIGREKIFALYEDTEYITSLSQALDLL